MSRFFSEKYRELEAYVPGEQPKGQTYIKLNTNESPFPPGEWVAEAVRSETEKLRLYSDPESTALREALAEKLSLRPEQLIMTNGSDEALNYAFMAFCDDAHPAAFPDITYGFYPVFAKINRVPYTEIPLKEDWSVDPDDYRKVRGPVFVANPNAPTGLQLPLSGMEKLLQANPDRMVVADEAYVDFGGDSALRLLDRYDNLLVVRTFSKSRSLAGLRLGFAAGNPEVIRDLKTMQYSTNPYNVDRLAQAAGIACLSRDEYNLQNVREIIRIREGTKERLRGMGFEVTDSRANFVFVRHPAFPSSELRDRLREKGILIRWFNRDRIRDWNRISIGTEKDMDALLRAISAMLQTENEERKP
ncbi:MAG: histidinol-phosphate transaminase [Clostridia bacterium]|nr:histidinol-phosphate transaminase [Clostridia bacterium]